MENLEDLSAVLDPSTIRYLLLSQLNTPVVLKGYLKYFSKRGKWNCLNWTRNEWVQLLNENPLNVRFGRRIGEAEILDSPQWESSCYKDVMKYEDLILWEAQEKTFITSSNNRITSDQYWAYFDYYYMKNLNNIELANQVISWEEFGFPEIKAKDSTLWIGTSGANTPCHIDTYGCNIVCQVYGKKQWILFPEKESPCLYPTRIPYEESSIYSKVGFPRPDIKRFPKFALTSPYVITLNPGDVLLVPWHWWHFVKNITFAISINTWIPLQTDHQERLKESLVMYQIGSMCQSISSPTLLTHIFNSNMIDVSIMSSEELLQLLQRRILYLIKSEDNKIIEGSKTCIKLTNAKETLAFKCLKKLNVNIVPKYSFHDFSLLIGFKQSSATDLVKRTAIEKDIFEVLINSFTDERVINFLKEVIIENLKL